MVSQVSLHTMEKRRIDFDCVESAASAIAGRVHCTPVVTCEALENRIGHGIRLFFKAENLQKTGSFKARGACHALHRLRDEKSGDSVVTHSSGNHGAALAWAARANRIEATVVMPENSLPNKIAAVRGYGAEVVLCDGSLAARQRGLEAVVERTGARFVPPYDDAHIIAGQGTAALELSQQVDGLETVLVPVGGGGLLAGTSLVGTEKDFSVVGVEPALADDAYRSFRCGVRQPPVDPPLTIADGLRTGLGELNWEIVRDRVEKILLVGEDQIRDATGIIMQYTKLVAEPSAAVPFAALLADPRRFAGQRIGIVISGGNLDLSLVRAG